jgi:hypothetical protein
MSAKVEISISASASTSSSKETGAGFICHLCRRECKSSAGFTKHLKACIGKKDQLKVAMGQAKTAKKAVTSPSYEPLKRPSVRRAPIIHINNVPDPIRKYDDILADLLRMNPGADKEAIEKTAKEMIKEAEEEDAAKKYEEDVKRTYEKIYANLYVMNNGFNKEYLQKIARDQAHKEVDALMLVQEANDCEVFMDES